MTDTTNTPEPVRLLACGYCYEENGEEVHPHPECPIGKTGTPARYRLRSDEEIEAVQWTGRNVDQLRAFCGPDFDTIDPEDRAEDPDQDAQLLSDASHWVGMKPGDWVLKHVDHFTATSDEAFRAMWETAVLPAVPVPPATHATDEERRERYAAAIREADGWVLDGGQHMIDAVMAVADGEQAELQRSLAQAQAEAHQYRTALQGVARREPAAAPAAVLREAATTAGRLPIDDRYRHHSQLGDAWDAGRDAVVRLLHRMADEEQPETEAAPHLTPSGNVRVDHLLRRPDAPAVSGPRAADDKQEEAPRVVRCSRAILSRPHPAHDWEPQPGMDPVHCPGHTFTEAPR